MRNEVRADSPYKGLIPYNEADSQFFFGRDAEREIIAANLMGSRLTVLYGPSGVGKSSVLCAGVVHDIREMAQQELDLRGRPKFIVVYFNTWRDDPLASLRSEIRKSVEKSIGPLPVSPLPTLSLADELQLWSESVTGKLLVILDQFEEYFLYSRKQDETAFADQFSCAVNRPDVRANFMISLREDWYTKLDRFKVTIANLFDNNLRVGWLNRDGARQAIEEPIKVYNSNRAANQPEITIRPGFSDIVLRQLESLSEKDVLGDSGSGEIKHQKSEKSIQTPYLQLVLNRLWYEAFDDGRVLDPVMLSAPLDSSRAATRSEEIIQSHLDSVMGELSVEEQDIAARALYHLVTPGGTKIAQQIGDLQGYTDLPESTLNAVLHKLSNKEMSILSQLMPPPHRPASQVRYEIFHDVLAPAVLAWRKSYISEKEKAEATSLAAEEAARAAQKTAEEAEKREKEAQRELDFQRKLAAKQKRISELKKKRDDEQALATQRELQHAQELAAKQQRLAETERRRVKEHIRGRRRARTLSLGLACMTAVALVLGALAIVYGRRVQRVGAENEARAAQLNQETETAKKKALESEQVARTSESRARYLNEQAIEANLRARASQIEAEALRRRADSALALADEAKVQAQRERTRADAAILQAVDASQRAKEQGQIARASERRAKEAIELADRINQLYQKATFLSETGNSNEAIVAYEALIPLYESNNNLKGAAATRASIGALYNKMGDENKAIQYLSSARQIYQSTNDSSAAASILIKLGEIYDESDQAGSQQKARESFLLALSTYEAAPDLAGAASARIKIAEIYAESDKKTDREKAIDYFNAAIKSYHSIREHSAETSAWLQLGDVYKAKAGEDSGDEADRERAKRSALDAYDRATQSAAEISNRGDAATRLLSIGRKFVAMDEREKAAQTYLQAANMFTAEGRRTDAAAAYTRAGATYTAVSGAENQERAIEAYSGALNIYLSAGDLRGQALSLRSIGSRYKALGNQAKALDHYNRAITLFEQLGSTTDIINVKKLIDSLKSMPRNEK